MVRFAAIDFETANRSPDSACSIGIVCFSGERITRRVHRLIRPAPGPWVFSELHGIRAGDVENQPRFRDVWREVADEIRGVEFIVAHNASFDARVLGACCRAARVPAPRLRFLCSLAIARDHLGIRPTNLPAVCQRLSIPLRHHDALSDAEAAGRIVLAAMAAGWSWRR